MKSCNDEEMMSRALQLARAGYGFVSPNPMVGAVITDGTGRIVGEGFHRCWGGAHAEVNAINSVRDKSVLPGCTVYVTLEPCSHYGKTPPCASLLIESGVKRVVVGCLDPFREVSGRGIAMLSEAGIDVTVGVLSQECEALNNKFMYAHRHRRPYVMLKWAQSADGFIAGAQGEPVKLSSPVSEVLMHRLRAGFDAIMAGTGTLQKDNPQLTCRLWPCRRLRPVVYDAHGHVPPLSRVFDNPDTIVVHEEMSIVHLLEHLYSDYGVTSLLVEGGTKLLTSFIEVGAYQRVRVEQSPIILGAGVSAPDVPPGVPECIKLADGHEIFYYQASHRVKSR